MGLADGTPGLRQWDLPPAAPHAYQGDMTIIVRFEPRNMNATIYAEVMRRLDAAGAGAPAGRIHHASYGSPDALHVIDIWDTPDSFRAFGATLTPILGSLGVVLGEPIIAPVSNIVRG
jgi:hypothetical protein